MTKCRVVSMLIGTLALASLAMAQSSQARSSPTKSGTDPLQTATKPLTPKSAMPTQRKSSAAVPATSTGNRNTTAELTHLERQKIKAGSSQSVTKGSGKGAPAIKPAETSAPNGSGINYKYQKPAGGMKATTPDANAKNSSTPRVKKN